MMEGGYPEILSKAGLDVSNVMEDDEGDEEVGEGSMDEGGRGGL